jgi:hypothetical protein
VQRGGEGGRRTLSRLVESASCGFQVASNAKNATVAVDHCALLHADYICRSASLLNDFLGRVTSEQHK